MTRSITLSGLLVLLLVTLSCTGDERSVASASATPFFNLSAYMATELTTLNAAGRTINKQVTIDGKTEQKQISSADFTNDLALFQRSDINKPAWVDKYRLEIAGNDTIYIATDSSLRTQQLRVERNEANEIAKITIKRSSGNILSKGRQTLVYEPGIGYRIHSEQKGGKLVGDAVVTVEVKL